MKMWLRSFKVAPAPLRRSVTTSLCKSGATSTPLGHDPVPSQPGTTIVPRYVFVLVSMTLTPLLTRSAKYKVLVEGSNDHMSVLAWVAPLGVQVGILI